MPNEFVARNGIVSRDNSFFTGSVLISGSLTVTGSVLGLQAVTFVGGGLGDASGITFNGTTTRTVSFNTVGANKLILTGSTVPGSVTGSDGDIYVQFDYVPATVTVSSGTASLDCSLGDYFNLTVPSSSTTFVSASNIQFGQTVNLRVIQQATTGSLSYSSAVIRFPLGIAYTGSASSSAVDVLTFVAFDSSSIFNTNINRY